MPFVRRERPGVLAGVADQLGRGDVADLEPQRGGLRAGDLEQLLDQLVQLRGGLDDPPQGRPIVLGARSRGRAA